MDERRATLERWLADVCHLNGARLEPASSDASFRRYFRVHSSDGRTFIAMDAPPDREDSAPFVTVARMLRAAGVNAPRVHHADLGAGLLLLDDFGSILYLDVLDDARVDRLYADAMDALARMQQRLTGDLDTLPPYDRRRLADELALFRDWFLAHHLGIELSAAESRVLETVFEALIDSALDQPRVFVHRDYHSRNLMMTERENPGVLDFQDAVRGPFTYDLVSLLRDCYIAWPRARVERWALDFHERAVADGVASGVDRDQFLQWFDLMGVQRHLKAIGIFARLWHRDGKAGYLDDIPRTLDYVLDVAARYDDVWALGELLERHGVRERL